MKIIIITRRESYLRDIDQDFLKFLVEIGILRDRLFYFSSDMGKTHLALSPDGGHFVIIRRDWSDCTEAELLAAKRVWEVII